MLAMDGRRIKNFDRITPVFTKGELPTPVIYALGTVTTVISFSVIALALAAIALLRRRGPPPAAQRR
jgi:hypothetical protein